MIEKEVVYNRRERACPSGKNKTAPAWYTRNNRGIAKKENEEYVYNDLLNKGLDDAKVLKDDLTRESIISLIN